jgi:hypothetical protein
VFGASSSELPIRLEQAAELAVEEELDLAPY